MFYSNRIPQVQKSHLSFLGSGKVMMTEAACANYALCAAFFMIDHLMKESFDDYKLDYTQFSKCIEIHSTEKPEELVDIWPWQLAPTGEPWKDVPADQGWDFMIFWLHYPALISYTPDTTSLPFRQQVYRDYDKLCNQHARLIPVLAGKIYGPPSDGNSSKKTVKPKTNGKPKAKDNPQSKGKWHFKREEGLDSEEDSRIYKKLRSYKGE